MGNFFKRNKVFLIFMGVLFVIIALFLLSPIVRAPYENALEGGEYFGKGSFTIFTEIITDVGGNISVAFSKNFSAYVEIFKLYALVYLGVTVVLLLKMSDKKEYNNIEHGSADWCGNKEKYSILSPKEGMILAEKTYLPVVPKPPEGKNGNILVIGGSGAGKSASFVIPNALQMLGSYVFTDPKGELYDRTAGFFKKNGYDVHVINLQILDIVMDIIHYHT